MFIGDGVNDSPVLAQAEVGVAINSASDVTVNAAGIVVMKDRLDDVLNAIRISKMTFRRIKINFGWAFVYNIILVPVAMGFLYPIGAHAGSYDPNSPIFNKGAKGL
jgi:P-type E1-E2 ATPase